MRRLHCLAFRAPPHGGARLGGGTAPAGGSARVGPRTFLRSRTRRANALGPRSQKVSGCPCVDDCRCYTAPPLRACPSSPGTKRDREEHRFDPQASRLVAASDSWPLFGVRLSADSRSGPPSDPSGACRKCTKASPWVALWPAPHGRAPNSEAAHRPSVPASMRDGGRPSRTVCGPSHRSSPAEFLARKLAEAWQSRPCRGGDRGSCGVACAWPPGSLKQTPSRLATLPNPSRVIG